MFAPVLLWSGIYSGSCTGTQVMKVSPAVLAWEAFQKVTDCTPGGIRGKQVFSMVRSWTTVRDAIRSTPGASPPCLDGRTWRDEYGICVSKGQTKSEQKRKALM